MITDKHDRFVLFGCEHDEDYSVVEASLGFFEMNLPPKLTLYCDRNFQEPIGEFALPKEVVGQMFEGIIQSIKLTKLVT